MVMVLPKPHTRPHYLLAGTAPVTLGLAALLARTQRERARIRPMPVRRATTSVPER